MLILFIVGCSNNTEKASNSTPYPLEKWNGVKGKTLADSKPDFVEGC